MVELKLESIEEQNLPRDCFISVRVGETQKLSRLAATRLYKFPQAGDRRYGKIEVFRRIGACSVDIDPSIAGLRDVSVNCNEAGFGSLGLRIGVGADVESKKKQEDPLDQQSKKQRSKVKSAKEYLGKHGLEVRLSEAMQSVLHDRPENPTEYLAMKLLGGEHRAATLPPLQNVPQLPDGTGMPSYQQDRSLPTDNLYRTAPQAQNMPKQLPPLQGRSAPLQAEPQPAQPQPPPTKATQPPPPAPPVAILPFGKTYHSKHFLSMPKQDFQNIYDKFPPPKKTASPQAAGDISALRSMAREAIVKASLDGNLQKALWEVKQPQAGPPVSVLPFQSFYKDHFKSSGVESFNKLHQSFPRAEAKPQITSQLAVLPFDQYYKNNVSPQAPLTYFTSIYSQFPAAGRPVGQGGYPNDISALRNMAREAIVKASLDGNLQKALWEVKQPQVAPPKFAQRASVGTWLMKKPVSVKPTPWHKKPSVGTWVSALPLYNNGVKVGRAAQEKPNAVAQPGSLEAIRLRVKNMLEDAANDGTLTEKIRSVKVAERERAFISKPSVCTWLAARLPPRSMPPLPAKPIPVSTRVMLGPSFYSLGVRPGVRIL